VEAEIAMRFTAAQLAESRFVPPQCQLITGFFAPEEQYVYSSTLPDDPAP